MAVYTQVSTEAMRAFLSRYDAGTLVSAKGIAEGVENSNYLVETSAGRFILTLYEKRVDPADLPYFLGLTNHLAQKGLPVPAPVADREGRDLQELAGRPACLIEFLPGVSVTRPEADLAGKCGAALARLHLAAEDYAGRRENGLGPDGWRALASELEKDAGTINPALPALIREELAAAADGWPTVLPRGTIHADLFPDNVLVLDGEVGGLIDFYFACSDMLAYDLAVTHAAWCFDPAGAWLGDEVGDALLAGYESVRPLSDEEKAAFPLLCRGASLRFLLTRAYDWLHTPPGAMVTRKDPMAFARRIDHYRAA